MKRSKGHYNYDGESSVMSNIGNMIVKTHVTETNSVMRRIPSAAPSENRSEDNRLKEIKTNKKSNLGIGPFVLDNSILNEINTRIEKIESFKNMNGNHSYSYAVVRNKNKLIIL